MSRAITTTFRNQIIADQLYPALFIKFEFESGDFNIWTGNQNKEWENDTYLGAGYILGIERIEESQDLKASSVSFTLSGIFSNVIALALTSNYQGRPVTMWFAVLDQNGSVLSNPYEVFKGRMDIIAFTDNGETSDFTIKCESNAIDIRKAKARRFTPEDQKLDYPDDKGLEFIPKIQDIEIVWG